VAHVHNLSTKTVTAIAASWNEIVTPVTGFGSYDELIESLVE